MPVIYRFGRRIDPVLWIGFEGIVGSIILTPVVVWLFGVIEVIGDRPVTAEDFSQVPIYLVCLMFGLLAFWMVWSRVTDSTYEVRLQGDRAEFLWLLGRIRVPVSSIRAIARVKSVRSGVGDPPPQAAFLRHARGTIKIRHFPEIDDLIRELTKANPLVEVTGEWPA
jgi:fumarate reductase subunit D